MELANWKKRNLTKQFEKAGLRECQFEEEDYSVHCWVGTSDKPPLMLVHGFGGAAIWQWSPQVKRLSKHYKLIVPDLLCFGDSHCDVNTVSLLRQGEALISVADKLNIQEFYIAGISYGGFVSYLMASRWPGRIKKIALIACPATVITAGDFDQVLDDFGVERINDLLLPEKPESVRRLLRVAWVRPPRVPTFVLKQIHKALFLDRIQEKEKLLNELTSYIGNIPSLPPSQSHETLIVWGEHDRIFPLYLGHRLRDFIGKRASIQVIAGSAHAPNHEKKKRFNEVLLEFFRRGSQDFETVPGS
jgi:pimeloyl-ACP methyl ester carboxylesterase